MLFCYLTAFGNFGGIEKFNKSYIKALSEVFPFEGSFYSLHDKEPEEKYIDQKSIKNWQTAGGNKIKFILNSLIKVKSQDVVILGHLNLGIIAILVKLVYPQKKVFMICHGIEVWQQNSRLQQQAYRYIDMFFAVSDFTRAQLVNLRKIEPDRIRVFHNTIDPYFEKPEHLEKPEYLVERYSLKEKKCILTVCRISSEEGYKGYDKILAVLPKVKLDFPDVRYVLAGKYDRVEKERLEKIIEINDLKENVVFTSFVKESELTDHFKLGDVFVMPSVNEGFGIVYIESMVCGVPVIAGNRDGSVDALGNGALGTLIDPLDPDDLWKAIINHLRNPLNLKEKKDLQEMVWQKFNFNNFRAKLQNFLDNPE